VLGARVAQRRRDQGLTQAALAERAGISYSYVSLLERGKGNVSLERLIALCRALDTNPSSLLEGIR
jgi:transcriptional regulator with XRE-family HTH domain